MKIVAVEAFNGSGYDLVFVGIYDEDEIKKMSPNDYDSHFLAISIWEDGKMISGFPKEISNEF